MHGMRVFWQLWAMTATGLGLYPTHVCWLVIPARLESIGQHKKDRASTSIILCGHPFHAKNWLHVMALCCHVYKHSMPPYLGLRLSDFHHPSLVLTKNDNRQRHRHWLLWVPWLAGWFGAGGLVFGWPYGLVWFGLLACIRKAIDMSFVWCFFRWRFPWRWLVWNSSGRAFRERDLQEIFWCNVGIIQFYKHIFCTVAVGGPHWKYIFIYKIFRWPGTVRVFWFLILTHSLCGLSPDATGGKLNWSSILRTESRIGRNLRSPATLHLQEVRPNMQGLQGAASWVVPGSSHNDISSSHQLDIDWVFFFGFRVEGQQDASGLNAAKRNSAPLVYWTTWKMNESAVWMATYAATFDGHPAPLATVNISKYPINSEIFWITSYFTHHLCFCPRQFPLISAVPSSHFPRFPPAHGPTREVDPKTSDAPSHRYVPPVFAPNSASIVSGTSQAATCPYEGNWTMIWWYDAKNGKTCNLGDWERWAAQGKLRERHGWGLIFVCNWEFRNSAKVWPKNS